MVKLIWREIEGSEKEFVEGKYAVGVLCQSNYGHKIDMHIGGVPIGKLLLKEDEEKKTASKTVEEEKQKPEGGRVGDGSIVIVILQVHPSHPLRTN
jgi:D-aminopeptidase